MKTKETNKKEKAKIEITGNQKKFEVSNDIICILQFEFDRFIMILLTWNTVN